MMVEMLPKDALGRFKGDISPNIEIVI